MPKELKEKSKWQYSLKEEHLATRFLIGLVITFSLAIFTHFKEVRVEMLELDSNAKNYIVAQVNFEFPDEEETVILRQQSVYDIGTIFRIDPKAIDQWGHQFENFLIHNPSWRNFLPNTSFEQLYYGSDEVRDLMQSLRFIDMRTLERFKSLDLLPPEYYPLPLMFDGRSVTFPKDFWSG